MKLLTPTIVVALQLLFVRLAVSDSGLDVAKDSTLTQEQHSRALDVKALAPRGKNGGGSSGGSGGGGGSSDPHDRGIFVMDCRTAHDACKNACYYINCRNGGNSKTYYDPDDNNDENRKQSGCNGKARSATGASMSIKSVCNSGPFSQEFADPQHLGSQAQCDEWPMADTKQQPFGAPGRRANSLRCMGHDNQGRSMPSVKSGPLYDPAAIQQC